MSKKRKLTLALGSVVLLIVVGVVGWRALLSYFVQRYYRTEYEPIPLAAGDVSAYPPEHHLDNVPWIAAQQVATWLQEAASVEHEVGEIYQDQALADFERPSLTTRLSPLLSLTFSLQVSTPSNAQGNT